MIVDISEAGACIQCSACYERGQPLAFIPQDLIDSGLRPVVGIVMWSRQCSETDYRHGIEFLGLNTHMVCKIREQVSQLSDDNSNKSAETQLFSAKSQFIEAKGHRRFSDVLSL